MARKAKVEDGTSDKVKELLAHGELLPPPSKEDAPPPPAIEDIVQDRKTRLQLIRALQAERQFAIAEAEAKTARKPLTHLIKTILGACSIRYAVWEEWTINYFETKGRKTIDPKKLVIALLNQGLSEDRIKEVLKDSTKKGKGSYTLRISRGKEESEEEESEDEN